MNSMEITEETLTFYYYNDGLSPRERQKVTQALAMNDALQAQYKSLCDQLDRLSTPVDIEPPADMVVRWHESIKSAACQSMPNDVSPKFYSWSFVWGVAVTAALAVGIGIGVMISGDDAEQPQETLYVAGSTTGSPFFRSLQVHLRESEAGLSGLALQSAPDKADLIISIIEQNRLFEKAAEKNQEHGVARVLRAFELVLIRIAADDTSAEDAEKLREKLMFELNVMLTKFSRDSSKEQQTI